MKPRAVLILALTLALLAAPLAAEAQQAGKVPRIALVFANTPVAELGAGVLASREESMVTTGEH